MTTSSELPVTVVIPTFNSRNTLKFTLESVRLQSFRDFEVCVVGDGCTDDSGDVVASFGDSRFRWTNLPRNSGGPAVPRNEGLRLARGKLIAYLGHDDLWFPWHLSRLVECATQGGADFLSSRGFIIGPRGVTGAFGLSDDPWHRQEDICPSGWMHRASVAQQIGGWSPSVRYGDDRDFLERIQKSGLGTTCLPEFSVMKFPSALWRSYARSSDFPQESFLKKLRENAALLRDELLKDLSTAPERGKRGFAAQWAVRFLDAYGRDRWPVNSLLRWRWRRRSGLAKSSGN